MPTNGWAVRMAKYWLVVTIGRGSTWKTRMIMPSTTAKPK
jgi:hypothetical protein